MVSSMALIYISWGTKQPPQALVDKMLEKVKAFHIVRAPELHFGPRWPNDDGTVAVYDQPCWHIRDVRAVAQAGSRGLECLQALLEGLQEGWDLREAQPEPPTRRRKV
jgi:hypothetical protein